MKFSLKNMDYKGFYKQVSPSARRIRLSFLTWLRNLMERTNPPNKHSVDRFSKHKLKYRKKVVECQDDRLEAKRLGFNPR